VSCESLQSLQRCGAASKMRSGWSRSGDGAEESACALDGL
jgi:hypothetical protein